MNKPSKQVEDHPPEQFTEAQRQEMKAWLQAIDKRAEEDAKEQAAQKAAVLRRIRTLRQKLGREAKQKGCTAERRKEIGSELQDLKELENQECGTGEPKHPSTRPSARELGFATDAPSVDEILEAGTIQRGLRLKKLHLVFAKLAKLNPARWGEAVKREAQYNPKIERTRERIVYGDIKEAVESKWFKPDRVIAGHYFKSQILGKPLRELSADEASVELCELGVKISPEAFERALRRLFLVD
jgi:hypothetical protein